MDCCNYPEYRAQYAWECAGGYAPYAPLQYAYAPACYAPHAHHYGRYGPAAPAPAYHYDYRHHLAALPPDHGLSMEYGAYASKESRGRRVGGGGGGRRDARRSQHHHLPLPHTPPLECGTSARGAAAYCEPHLWPTYQQMGAMSASPWAGVPGGSWEARSRDQSRRALGFPSSKVTQSVHNQMCQPEGRSTPYRLYEEPTFSPANALGVLGADVASGAGGAPCASEAAGGASAACERAQRVEAPRAEAAGAIGPSAERRAAALVPLPAFQQAFGSTEIGRFAEAFSRAEAAQEQAGAFTFEAFGEWESAAEPAWSPLREIKCENPYSPPIRSPPRLV